MDTFFEFLVKRKKTTKDIIITALTVIIAIAIIILLTTLYLVPLVNIIAFPLQALVIYLCYKFISKLNIEFEYAITNGELEVDKIINKQKRTSLLSLESRSINLMVPLGDDRIPEIDERNIIDATSGDENTDIYCVIYGDSSKYLLLFEPTAAMAEELRKRNPRNVFLKD